MLLWIKNQQIYWYSSTEKDTTLAELGLGSRSCAESRACELDPQIGVYYSDLHLAPFEKEIKI
jgi:hypothetical protein